MNVLSRDTAVDQRRPEPDEVELEPVRPSARDLFAAAKRAAKAMVEDNMLMIASALAYSTFFAIPSVLLVAIGVFTLVASIHTNGNRNIHAASSSSTWAQPTRVKYVVKR